MDAMLTKGWQADNWWRPFMYGAPTGGAIVPPVGWPIGIGFISPRAWKNTRPEGSFDPAEWWRPAGHSYSWLVPAEPCGRWADPPGRGSPQHAGSRTREVLGNGASRYPRHAARSRAESIRVLAPLVLPHLQPPHGFSNWDEVARTVPYVADFDTEDPAHCMF